MLKLQLSLKKFTPSSQQPPSKNLDPVKAPFLKIW